MNLFYAPPEQCTGNIIYLKDDEAHHAAHVLRYKVGDMISVVDGRRRWFDGEIISITKEEVSIAVKRLRQVGDDKEPSHLVLALGLIKNRQRLEFAVEKAVELGATEIILFQSQNTEREKVRMDRLELIARSAMKQSLRSWLPGVRWVPSVYDIVDEYKDYRLLLAHEKHDGDPEIKREWLNSDRLLVLIGPEGGFADEEVKTLTDSGAQPVSLGDHRLRSETAALAFLARMIH